MKTQFLAWAACMILGCSASIACAQDVGTWGIDGLESKWRHKSEYYNPPTNYKYYGQTPRLENFPKYLAEAAQRPPLILDLGKREYAVEHLKALSRCDFYHSREGTGYPIDQWEQWWHRYGKPSLAEYEEKGRRYPEVWKRMPATEGKPCPDYKILVPEVWSAEIKFRAGGIAAIREEISFDIDQSECRLRRRYRRQILDESWTREEWNDLTREEANDFYAMLIYAIDHPWLYKDDPWMVTYYETIEGKEYGRSHVRGRGEQWTTLYSGTSWSGIRNAKGHVIINEDPSSWHSDNPRYNFLGSPESVGKKGSVVDGPWLEGYSGVVFRVVRDCFPDPAWKPNESRWVNVDLPKIYDQSASAAQQAVLRSIYEATRDRAK